MLERCTDSTGVVYYASPVLRDAGIAHGFSTRIGGVSEGPFASLNLGNPQGDVQDSQANIAENYGRLHRAIGLGHHPRCYVHQVHGCGVERVTPGGAFENGKPADAIVSTDSTRAVAVRVADCVPVLLATSDGRAVAAVHAGWRGVIAQVAIRAAEQLRMISDTPILAAIGPCISFNAFEVGNEVLDEFRRAFGDRAPIRRAPQNKGYVDLRAAVHLQLSDAGVRYDHIDTSDRCTVRDADEFFSHRRDNGITGRMAALIAAK